MDTVSRCTSYLLDWQGQRVCEALFFLWVVFLCVLTCLVFLMDGISFLIFICLFTILCPFEIREFVRRKVDHGGQIVLWYWQHATNLTRATVFVVCMSSARVLHFSFDKTPSLEELTLAITSRLEMGWPVLKKTQLWNYSKIESQYGNQYNNVENHHNVPKV